MKLYIQRSGGLDGSIIDNIIDMNSIKSEEYSVIKDLTAKSNFFDLPHSIQTAINPADCFSYKLTIDEGTRKHTVIRTDNNIEPMLYDLINYLLKNEFSSLI